MSSIAQPLAHAPTQVTSPSPSGAPTFAETCGHWLGAMASPLVAWTTGLRRARTFHPHGDVLVGRFVPPAEGLDEDLRVGQRLAGHVLLRFSDALAKEGPQRFDVLGCALRFALEESGSSGVQDLLFATIARPWTMALAPFMTETRDYLANDYFAVSPFETPDHGRVWFRLRTASGFVAPPLIPSRKRSAAERRQLLSNALERDELRLELGAADGPWGPWRALGTVVMERLLDEDPAELAFDPFANSAGVVPRGFVHALRQAVYARGQARRGASRGWAPVPPFRTQSAA